MKAGYTQSLQAPSTAECSNSENICTIWKCHLLATCDNRHQLLVKDSFYPIFYTSIFEVNSRNARPK